MVFCIQKTSTHKNLRVDVKLFWFKDLHLKIFALHFLQVRKSFLTFYFQVKDFLKDQVLYIQCDSKEEFSKSIQLLIQNGISLYSIYEIQQDLESYYKELYKG